jgi:hypothetical protein
MVRNSRSGLALLLVAVFGVLAVSTASAASTKPNFDAKFGRGGTLNLQTYSGKSGSLTQTCEVSGGRLRIAARFGRYAPELARWTSSHVLATATVNLRRLSRLNYTNGTARIKWTRQTVPAKESVIGSDYGAGGDFVYATEDLATSGKLETVNVFRVGANTKRVKSFGDGGRASVTLPGFLGPGMHTVGEDEHFEYTAFRVIAMKDSGVLVLAQAGDKNLLVRLDARGEPDSSWGDQGRVELPRLHNNEVFDSVSETADGGILIASRRPGDSVGAKGVGLLRLGRDGTPLASWGDNGYWTPPAFLENSVSYFGSVRRTALLDSGEIAVFYWRGQLPKVQGEIFIGHFNVAYVDATTGQTKFAPVSFDQYQEGSEGDGGSWDDDYDSHPLIFSARKSGPVMAETRSWHRTQYGHIRTPGSYFGSVAGFSPNDAALRRSGNIDLRRFPVDQFAADPDSRYVYLCGTVGSKNIKYANYGKLAQRVRIAVRRMSL